MVVAGALLELLSLMKLGGERYITSAEGAVGSVSLPLTRIGSEKASY